MGVSMTHMTALPTVRHGFRACTVVSVLLADDVVSSVPAGGVILSSVFMSSFCYVRALL